MKKKTESILAAMNVLSWVVFIGLLIKAGVILISYGVSIGNPEAAKNLYRGMDLYNIRKFDLWHYTTMVSFIVAIILLEVYIAFLVIKVLSKVKLSNPFTTEVSKCLEKISYFILGVWVVSMLFNIHISWLSKSIDGLKDHLVPGEFIFLAGVVFIFSQIFKKGVEIQSENELTV